jgi:hypothetical protein
VSFVRFSLRRFICYDDGVHFNLNYKLLNNPKAYEAFEIFLNASGTEKILF